MSHTVYLITNTANGCVYVGQTDDPARRFSQHMRGNGGAPALREAVRTYGRFRFTFEILEVCQTLKGALDVEEQMIQELDARVPGLGYNLPRTGGVGDNTNARACGVDQIGVFDGAILATFRSLKQASEQTGIARTSIGRVCRACGQNPKFTTAGGYRWRFTEE